MIDCERVRQLLADFEPGDRIHDIESLTKTVDLLDTKSNPFDRHDYDPGHITASAIVLSPDLESVILVNHVRVGLWIQPGGHIEPADSTLIEAASREVTEETGLALSQDSRNPLVRVDVHEIPPFKDEPRHWHHDLTFARRAPSQPSDTIGDSEWAWCPVADLDHREVEPALKRSIHRARAHYANHPTGRDSPSC